MYFHACMGRVKAMETSHSTIETLGLGLIQAGQGRKLLMYPSLFIYKK